MYSFRQWSTCSYLSYCARSTTLRRTYKLDNQPTKLVSNIHVTLLIGYDDDHYYYIDPLLSHIGKLIVFPALIPNKYQVIKIKNPS